MKKIVCLLLVAFMSIGLSACSAEKEMPWIQMTEILFKVQVK